MKMISSDWQRKFISIIFGFLAASVLLLSGCRDKQIATQEQSDLTLSDVTTLLVTIPENDKPPESSAVSANHIPNGALADFYFSENGKSVAYSVRNPGYSYVSFNGKPGKVYKADVTPVVLSSNGKRFAYGAQVDGMYHMVIDGIEGTPFSQIKDAQFSPDSRHVAYSGLRSGLWSLIVDSTLITGNSLMSLQHFFSGDSTRIAYVDNVNEKYEGRLVVTDLKFRERNIVAPSGVASIVSNNDKTMVAAIVSTDGKKKVISFNFANPGAVKTSPAFDSVSNVIFAQDGRSVTYTAEKSGAQYIILNDREFIQGDDSRLLEPPVVLADLKVLGAFITNSDEKEHLREYFVTGSKDHKKYDKVQFLTYRKDGVPTYAAASKKINAWFTVVDGREGPPFERVVLPRFSPDGRYLVYRARKDGKRFVVVADATGKVIKQHPAYDQVFDVQFIAGGKSVAYGVKDGNRLIWKVEAL